MKHLYTRTETVEAHQWLPADPITAGATLGWLLSDDVEFTHGSGPEATLTLHIDGQQMILQPGDWLVRHPDQGHSVVDHATFTATYDRAKTPSRPRRGTVINTVGDVSAGAIIQTGGDYYGSLRL
ncbi:hypothetical protein ACFWZ7_21960 [Nocardiopsis alba]|uniref:hypothetical protein n=1 Tax=Nocardiopsis alba TaxID=53437 RepID=UPI00366BB837